MIFSRSLAIFLLALLMGNGVACATTEQVSEKDIYSAAASVYSSTKFDDCRYQKDEEMEEHGAALYICPSFDRYRIEVIRWERVALNLVYQDKTLFSYNGAALGSSIGEKIEWRYHKNGQDKQYHGLIFRIYMPGIDQNGIITSDVPATQDLVVARLDQEKSCIIGIIPQSKNMNELARGLADHKNAVCMDQ